MTKIKKANKMNISLDDYTKFSEKLELSALKDVNGAFVYVDKITGDVIHPYLLGKLYRLIKQEAIDELTKIVDSFEYDIIKEKHKLKELPSVVKEEISNSRYYIDMLKKDIE